MGAFSNYSRYRYPTTLIAICALAPVSSWYAAGAAPPDATEIAPGQVPVHETGPDLLERVFREQEKGLDRISSYSAEFVIEGAGEDSFRKERQSNQQSNHIRQWQKGDLFLAVVDTTSTTRMWNGGDWSAPVSNHLVTRNVLNGAYRASFMTDLADTRGALFEIHDRTPGTRDDLPITGFAALAYCAYGSGLCGAGGGETLRDMFQKKPADREWTAERKVRGGRDLVILRIGNVPSNSKSLLEYEIDPDRGWMTVSCTELGDPETTQCPREVHATLEPSRDASGVWFPKVITIRSEDVPADKSHRWSRMRLEVITLDLTTPIPDDYFRWQSLGYPGGFGIHISENADRQRIIVTGDEWKPFEEPKRK